MESEALAAQKDLMRTETKLRKMEEMQQKAEEAEKERKETERKRQMDKKRFEENLWLKDEEIAKQKKKNKEVSKSLEVLKQTMSKKSDSWTALLVPAVLGIGIGLLLSDRDLKHNITTLPLSPYNTIGLTGVCWEWNKIAEEKLL